MENQSSDATETLTNNTIILCRCGMQIFNSSTLPLVLLDRFCGGMQTFVKYSSVHIERTSEVNNKRKSISSSFSMRGLQVFDTITMEVESVSDTDTRTSNTVILSLPGSTSSLSQSIFMEVCRHSKQSLWRSC